MFLCNYSGLLGGVKGDWNEGYRWKNKDGLDVTDVGGNFMKQLADRRVDWMPLLRSNKKDLHPLFFGVYADLIYHHGAGFRKGESRADHAHMKLSLRDRILSATVPGYKRSVRKKAVAEFVAKNHALSEQIFSDIVANPKFYEQFS